MKSHRLGCLSISGIITAMLTLTLIIGISSVRVLFSPGKLSVQANGETLEGVGSHNVFFLLSASLPLSQHWPLICGLPMAQLCHMCPTYWSCSPKQQYPLRKKSSAPIPKISLC